MAAADVKFFRLGEGEAFVGQEQTFSFSCPRRKRRCSGLVIAGRTNLKRDPNGRNDGIAQWDWDGDRINPTFSPSINCGGCWHGFIEKGRTVDVAKRDEPEL